VVQALVRDRQQQVGSALLETWLNDVLAGRSAEEPKLDILKADPVTKTGLVSFGMSREALASAGLNQAAIDRLYRGLYVYTVGFSDMMQVLQRS
jgi:hypothetical protein